MDVVTGATGFVGPHLVAALAARGRRVTCLVRDRTRGRALGGPGVDVQEGDLLDAAFLRRTFAGVEHVYHLAGGGKVSTATDAGLTALRTANVAPVDAVVRAAAEAGARRVVHFSSISAMGVQLDVDLDEESRCLPSTPHEIAKRESEQVALDVGSKAGVPVVVLRPSQIYGPGDVRSEILKLVRLARRGAVPLFDGGLGRVPWVFVSDVVDAALAAADAPAAPGRIYNVSDAESYRFGAVVAVIARALGRSRGGVSIPTAVVRPTLAVVETLAKLAHRDPPFTRHRLASMCGDRRVSIARARRELAFSPRVSLDEGMPRTVAWYLEQGLL